MASVFASVSSARSFFCSHSIRQQTGVWSHIGRYRRGTTRQKVKGVEHRTQTSSPPFSLAALTPSPPPRPFHSFAATPVELQVLPRWACVPHSGFKGIINSQNGKKCQEVWWARGRVQGKGEGGRGGANARAVSSGMS